MNIALINVSGKLSSEGSRLISSLLKRAGHSVKMVFLARLNPVLYEPEEIEQLHEILDHVDLAMIAVYSHFAIRAIQVTEFIHKKYPGLKVIWGGPHCISAPEISLQYADGVCFAEGDQVIVELVNRMEAGQDYFDVPNMGFKERDGSNIFNGTAPMTKDLDNLPYSDYCLEDHFLLDRELIPMTKEKVAQYYVNYPFGVPTFYILTSLGCPHKCTYCNNVRYLSMYGRNPMRYRSIDHMIGEMEQTLGFLDFFTRVVFGDDDFFTRPTAQLEEFAEKYKKRVGLPFGVACSGNTYKKEKMDVLLDAGLKVLQIGVQTASERTLREDFDRPIRVEKIKRISHQLKPYNRTHGLELLLDFIIDNPYENEDDIIQTYNFMLDLPDFIKCKMFCLAFFPGTPIYDRALEDGYCEPYSEKSFRSYLSRDILFQNNYETFLVLFFVFLHHSRLIRYVPRFLLRFLGLRPVRYTASIIPKSYYTRLNRYLRNYCLPVAV